MMSGVSARLEIQEEKVIPLSPIRNGRAIIMKDDEPNIYL